MTEYQPIEPVEVIVPLIGWFRKPLSVLFVFNSLPEINGDKPQGDHWKHTSKLIRVPSVWSLENFMEQSLSSSQTQSTGTTGTCILELFFTEVGIFLTNISRIAEIPNRTSVLYCS